MIKSCFILFWFYKKRYFSNADKKRFKLPYMKIFSGV